VDQSITLPFFFYKMKLLLRLSLLIVLIVGYVIDAQDRIPSFEANRRFRATARTVGATKKMAQTGQWTMDGKPVAVGRDFRDKHLDGKRNIGRPVTVNTVIAPNQRIEFTSAPHPTNPEQRVLTSRKNVRMEDFRREGDKWISTGTSAKPLTVVTSPGRGKRPEIVHFGGAYQTTDEDYDSGYESFDDYQDYEDYTDYQEYDD
jgi:hypothetical protein